MPKPINSYVFSVVNAQDIEFQIAGSPFDLFQGVFAGAIAFADIDGDNDQNLMIIILKSLS